MTRTRLHPLLSLTLMILAITGIAAPTPIIAQTPNEAASTGARFDVMVADAKATMLIDPAKTIEKAKLAEIAAANLEGRRGLIGKATAEWLQGEAYLRLNDVGHAQPLIDHALVIISTGGKPTKLNGDLLLSRGGVNTVKANVAAALSDYQRAHNIFRDLGETRSRTIALLSIALLYQEAADYENALKYYRQASEIYDVDPQLLLTIYNNQAVCFKEMGRNTDAERQFRQALTLARTMKTPVLEVQILRNIARTQLADNRLAEADRTIAEQGGITRLNHLRDDEGQASSVAAQSAFQHGDIAHAVTLIGQSFSGVDTTETTLAFRGSHETAYDIYRRSGNQQLALVHLEALKRLDDKKSTLAASANTSLAAARFDFANQELRIAKLKADELQRNIDFERARAQTQRFIFIGIAAVTVIIVSMLAYGIVTLRRSRNQVRAANIDLAATNDALGKALAAKTEFLATTSHEIRTPLNGILGMTQVMLADRNLNEATRDRINVVHGAGVTMRALVDDILDVAKMETGNMTIEQVPLDLKATLRDVSRMWEEQAKGRGIGYTLDLDASPDWIQGDAARLRQIVFNLMSNALKFTETGGVSLAASAAGGQLRIAIKDSGIGIPPEKHELIFESFRQVDAGTTRKFGGTGLGLSICRNLARAMHGDVRVESVAGEGSTFVIELPLLLTEPPEQTAAVVNDEKGALLIVDRSPITRAMLRAVLEQRAGVILFAGSVEEAVARLGEGGISQALIDDATVKAAANVETALAEIAAAALKISAQTTLLWSSPNDAQRTAFSRAGINAIISKPFVGAALADALYPVDDSALTHLVSRAA